MEGGFDLSKEINALKEGVNTGLEKGVGDITNVVKTAVKEGVNTGLEKGVGDITNVVKTAVKEGVNTGLENDLTVITGKETPALNILTPSATPESPKSPEPVSSTKTSPTPDTTKPDEKSYWILMIEKYATIKNAISLIVFGLLFVIIWFIIRFLDTDTGIKQTNKPSKNTPVDIKEQNSKQVKIDEVERQLQERISNINTNLTTLKKRMDDADIVKDNKPTNLAIAIQNNILAVKEAMMKIIAGLVVQTKMNNGALSVVSQTNAFQQGINDSLSKLK